MAFNPLSWGNFNLQDPFGSKLFLQQITSFLNLLVKPTSIAQILNGNAVLGGVLFQAVDSATITTAGSRTVDCTGAQMVALNYAITGVASLAVTLTNLAAGTLVMLRAGNSSGGSRTVSVVSSGYTIDFFTPIAAATTVTVLNGQNVAVNGQTFSNILFLVGGIG